MRLFLPLLFALPLFATAQSAVDDGYALELIRRLENDPRHAQYTTDIQLIFRWMDESSDLMGMMNHPELNKIAGRKRDYREQMQILYLGGMLRYLKAHPDQTANESPIVRMEGRSCMCIGYANLRKKHKTKRDRYISRLCRNQ
jgi:hypothetical protein